MLKNYLKITWRNMMKNKLFVFINIFGLGLALSCCIVAYLNWEYNSTYDTYHYGTDEVYRVNFIREINGRSIQNGSCPIPLGGEIKSTFSQVENVMRYNSIGGNFRVGDEVFRTSIALVDIEFLEVFNFPMEYGNKKGLSNKGSMVISTELRDKYFPNTPNPVGETLLYINDEGKRVPFEIVGVFTEPARNTSFFNQVYINYDHLTDLMNIENTDWASFNTTFVQLKNNELRSAVEKQLQQYVEVQNRAKEDYKVARFYLDPFVGMAVRAESENTWNHWFRSSLPGAAASAPGIMAALILLIACFNFTNTSIGIANRRIKEIGIRKVLGSEKKQLVLQFMGENTILVFLALLVGIGIAGFLVPYYSSMWPFLEIFLFKAQNLGLLGFLCLLMLFTALIAGSYPSFYVSNFQPQTILQRTLKFGGTNVLTKVLLTLQFAISLLAIISGFVFSENATFQKEYDMGFKAENVAYAYVADEQGFRNMRNSLNGYGEIESIAGSNHNFTSSWYTDPVTFDELRIDVNLFDVGTNYLSTVGATILAGRDFVANSQQDVERSVLVNEEFVKAMKWEEAVNKRILLRDTLPLTVVGVVKNVFFDGGLWDPLEPMLIRYAPEEDYRFIAVRTNPSDVLSVKELMEEKWKENFPDQLSTVNLMSEEKADMALVNLNIKTMFIFLGSVAALLSAIGLFSLLSLNLLKRMKEIGIRKVLGATIPNIALKVSKEFVIILVIASLLGCVGGFYLSDMLMSNIWAYHVPFRLLPFMLSVILIFVVSILAVGGKVFRAASVNPAVVLKDE
jgi:ABC-type antimicrobial peptide transport system permease subunit